MQIARLLVAASLLSSVVIGSLATTAQAQGTTATLRGTVRGDDGVAMAEAEVTLVDESTGVVKTTTSNADGVFVFTNLQVGGPYRVTSTVMGFKPSEAKDIFLTANRTRDVSLSMRLQEEVIEVEGSGVARNTSNRTVITAAEIDSLPSGGRDPRDVVRRNPEVTVEGGNKALYVGGNNNRFNSITVDGTRQDDDFGLNGSGYPTRRSPIALSAIQELTVESSPFDVHFGKFLGGNVNIITKSGTNEFKGSLVGTYTNDSFAGSRSREDRLAADYREIRYGATLGGPIIKDQLFFLASIEGLNSTQPVSVGPNGSGAATTVTGVTQDQLNEIIAIAREVYGYQAGVASDSLEEGDLKLLGKLDWHISPQHRASVIYQRTSGNSVQQGSGATLTLLPLSSNWYDAKDNLNTFAGRLYSDWSDELSTQFEVTGKLVSSRVPSLGGNEFMSASITTATNTTVTLGPDVNRHSNLLDNDVFHARAEANYLLSSHLLTAGADYEYLRIKNLFLPRTLGDATYASVDAFRAMTPTQVRYANSRTLNPEDAAADWNLGTWTGYVQDQFKLTNELTLQAGIRAEIYQTSDEPTRNPLFFERYGFDNTTSLNGKSIILPRLGISWLPMDNLNVRAGVGLYSGGTPGVWASNNYTNDGIRTFSTTFQASNPQQQMVINGFDGREIRQELKDAVVNGAAAGAGQVDVLDPDFKLPSTWKLSAGADYALDLPGVPNIEIKANYTFSKVQNGVLWQDLRRDLRFIPNNAPLTDENGDVIRILPGRDGRPLYPANYNINRGFDFMLTNISKGHGHVGSLVLQKGFPFGLFVSGSYTYTNNKDVSPGTASTAQSNYVQVAVTDPNHPDLATSNYERRHRFTGTLEYSQSIVSYFTDASPWKEMKTSLGVFVESRSGQPFSWTFSGPDNNGTALGRIFGEDSLHSRRNHQLAYIPNAGATCTMATISESCEVILNNVDEGELNTFLERSGLDKYRGRIAPRNAFRGRWFNKLDLRVSQDLPNPLSGHRARFVLDIENMGNLLNKSWGRSEASPFFYAVPIIYNVDYDRTNNKYVFSKPVGFRPTNPGRVDLPQSVWRINLGLMYDF